jgi:hypothetical protein
LNFDTHIVCHPTAIADDIDELFESDKNDPDIDCSKLSLSRDVSSNDLDRSCFEVQILDEIPITPPHAPPTPVNATIDSNTSNPVRSLCRRLFLLDLICLLLQWILYTDSHVLPPYGIDSPVVKHLLDNWTDDLKKVSV